MKSRFDNQPVLLPEYKTDLWRLGNDWYFYIDGKTFWVPTGYTYDGASIPRPVWSIIGSPFEPRYMAAALAHDWLYLMHLVGRSVADEVFFQLLRQCGVGLWRARIMWGAVRSCGYPAWTNNEADNREIARIRTLLSGRSDGGKFLV